MEPLRNHFVSTKFNYKKIPKNATIFCRILRKIFAQYLLSALHQISLLILDKFNSIPAEIIRKPYIF